MNRRKNSMRRQTLVWAQKAVRIILELPLRRLKGFSTDECRIKTGSLKYPILNVTFKT